MPLTLEDTWIKAAVEHRLVTVTYENPETRLVYTKRDIRPDYIGPDRSGSPALWGVLNHNPMVGVKSFQPQYFKAFKIQPQKFQPEPNGRWNALVAAYNDKKLNAAPE
ncbi:MAG: hypothetical protein ACYDCK_07500 [Thermoplasmatota archaeon]